MNAFSRSWEITKLSFSVINQDRELLFFPILGSFFSLLYVAAIIVPSWLFLLRPEHGAQPEKVVYWVGMFLVYFGLAFFATFFNVCVVYTTKRRFDGGNATFGESIGFAFSKIHLIFAWSAVAASVGILLRILDRAAERAGFVGRIMMSIVVSFLGLAWSIITIFVVPAMVYRDLGPIDAIKQSTRVLRKTWGESLIRHYGLGLMQFLFIILGAVVFVGLSILSGGGALTIAVLVLAAIYFVGVITTFNLANMIFNTALYVYADRGKIPGAFSREVVVNAIRPR